MPGTIPHPDRTQGHAALFYESPSEPAEILSQFFKTGIEQNELCVYISSQAAEDILAQFASYGFDARPALEDTSLRILDMHRTYLLPSGQFLGECMLHNMDDYMSDALGAGYHGLRAAGDMAWLHDHPEATDETVAYEEQVDVFCSRNPHFNGLCLYPAVDAASDALAGIFSAHPTLITGGTPRPNAGYSRPIA